jgi:prepilin-type N-terminal cleavage/methylation domain-containing protein
MKRDMSQECYKVSFMRPPSHFHGLPKSEAGFSLVEMMIAVMIVGVLVALLFPAVDRARLSATSPACMGHQKQIVAAMMSYAADNNGRLPDMATTTAGGESGIWYEVIGQYLNLANGKYPGRDLLRCPAASKKVKDFSYGINYSTGGLPNRDSVVFTRMPADGPTAGYPGSKRLGGLSPSTILLADTLDEANPASTVFYHPKSPNWSVDTDKDGDGVKDSAGNLGAKRKFNCIDPRHSGKAFIGTAADGSARLLTIRQWIEEPKYWGPSLDALNLP